MVHSVLPPLELAAQQARGALAHFLASGDRDTLLWTTRLYRNLDQLCSDARSQQAGGFSTEMFADAAGPSITYLCGISLGKGIANGYIHATSNTPFQYLESIVHPDRLRDVITMRLGRPQLDDKALQGVLRNAETYGEYLGYNQMGKEIIEMMDLLHDQPAQIDLMHMVTRITSGKTVQFNGQTYNADAPLVSPDADPNYEFKRYLASVNQLCALYRDNPQLKERILDTVSGLVAHHAEHIAEGNGYSIATFAALVDFAGRMKLEKLAPYLSDLAANGLYRGVPYMSNGRPHGDVHDQIMIALQTLRPQSPALQQHCLSAV